MKTKSPKPTKVSVTIHITKEAQDTMFDNGYASARTVGEFLSQLVMEHHARVTRKPAKPEIARELRRLADMLDEVTQIAPDADPPLPLANVVDAPSDLVGVTVIDEEPGPAGETIE
jgi:hypothetical protein